jgi:hypothetical protein
MSEVCDMIPENFKELKELYCIFLTLPVTTASVERGFSKMALVKNKLRSVMTQARLQALLLCNIEQDLCSSVDPSLLVSKFAQKADRRFELNF